MTERMTREEFGRRVAAAVMLEKQADRERALATLIGHYGAHSVDEYLVPPAQCSCGALVPGRYVTDDGPVICSTCEASIPF